ncbi:MAG: HK97 family phage prohead protease [Gammaproteobacteria bacterium]
MADQRIEKAYGGAYLKSDGGLDRFRFSSNGIDRDRQIVNQQGIDTNGFGGTFFWGHDAYGGGLFGGTSDIRNVLGAVRNLEVKGFSRNDGSSGEGLEGDVQFATQINPRADMAQKFVRAGILGKTSIGFLRQKAHKEIRGGEEILLLDKIALLEISLVPIPSNDEAETLINSMARDLGSNQDVGTNGWIWHPHDNLWELKRGDWPEFRIDGGAVLEMAQEMDSKGIVPGNVSTKTAPEGTRWSALSLSDFTETSWASISDSRKRRIIGHFAWAESTIPTTFGGLKLGHHRASDGAVVFRGVSAAMGSLNGARAPLDIPDRDRRKVHTHLASHYRQFGRTAPELRSSPPPDGADNGLAESVRAAVSQWGREERLRRAVRRAYAH